MKYYIIAGEASGDLHGSNLMKGLKSADPQSNFRFWGGDLMSAVGGTLVRHYKETAVMGFVEVIGKLGKISSNLNYCKQDILNYSPDVLILIDYPGFNLKIAKFAKLKGIKVFYYISPKVWAWKENRIKLLKKYISKLFIIFPFEIEYFKKHGIDAIYCGNPLLDSISQDKCMKETKEEFLHRNSLPDKKIISILAGSRKSEIDWLLPRFTDALKQVQGDYQFLLAAAPSIPLSYYEKYLSNTNIIPIISETYSILKNSEAAIIASGTASLEAAIIGTPQVVCYGGNPISFAIAKRIVKIPYVSLGNLIINRLAFKELLQNQCSADNIASEIFKLLNDKQYVDEMLESYMEIKKCLGEEGASLRVAQSMINELKK